MQKKIFIICGEASGDLHASNAIAAMLQQNNNLLFKGWGGNLMQQKEVTILKHYKDLAFMGFAEVLKNINTIRKNFKICKQQILNFNPDLIIFVDYPGFNLRMAKWAKINGYKTCYYISPQIWAWKEGRIKSIKKYIDKMIVILPFEKDFYSKHKMQVDYVGHPLVPVISNFKANNIITKPFSNKPIVALLPGSRKQEINKKLPIMLGVSLAFPNYQFIIAKAPGVDDSFYEKFIQNNKNISVVSGNTYKLLQQSQAALVTSGTATLETALFKVPQIVCYKGSAISFAIAKKLLKIKYISLVNLIMDKKIVPELIQQECTVSKISMELQKLLPTQNEERIKMLNDYEALINLLSIENNASNNTASLMLEML